MRDPIVPAMTENVPKDITMTSETALLTHFRAMQRMATAYIVPEPYVTRAGKTIPNGDNYARETAFASDMLYMLDGPEQREAERLAALSRAPEAEEPELTADFLRGLPGGGLDDSEYQAIEDALDRLEAPCQAENGRWLKLHERVSALSPPSSATDSPLNPSETNHG